MRPRIEDPSLINSPNLLRVEQAISLPHRVGDEQGARTDLDVATEVEGHNKPQDQKQESDKPPAPSEERESVP